MVVAGRSAVQRPDELVAAVAGSQSFSRSPALRKLLLYLWEHRDGSLSEYAIALDVFGKREEFDSRIDATVRVQMSRLRQKLKEYYEKEGNGSLKRVVIPAGSHHLEIEQAPPLPGAPTHIPWNRYAAIAVLVLLVVLLWWNISLRRQLSRQQAAQTLPAFWQSILAPGRLTRITYPIPVFYNWQRLRVRDVVNNDPLGWQTSVHLAPFVKQFGAPALSQSYSVSSDTAAAIQLTRFLAERKTPLDVSPSASLSLDQFGNDNLIFLGIPPTNAALTVSAVFDPKIRVLHFLQALAVIVA